MCWVWVEENDKMKKAAILLLFFHLSVTINPQTISVSGNVKDLSLNFPIENAKVQIKNLSNGIVAVSYTHLRAHETVLDLVCRLLLEKKKTQIHHLSFAPLT